MPKYTLDPVEDAAALSALFVYARCRKDEELFQELREISLDREIAGRKTPFTTVKSNKRDALIDVLQQLRSYEPVALVIREEKDG